MTARPKPHIHGRDHEHGGADPTLIHWEDVGEAGSGAVVDSTENVGDPWGVHSAGPETAGYLLTADGSGGSEWAPAAGGGGGAGGAYGAASASTLTVASGFSGYLNFGAAHTSGISISGAVVSIVAAGTYEVLAAGTAGVDGTATFAAAEHLQMLLEVNGSGGSPYAYVGAMSPVDISAGRKWHVPMTLLDQQVFAAGDVLKFQGVNTASVAAFFDQWRLVIRELV